MAKKNNGKQDNGMEPFGTHGPGTVRKLIEHPSYKNKDPKVQPYTPPGQLQTTVIQIQPPTKKKK